jgi:kynurenine 3-monooxygenase
LKKQGYNVQLFERRPDMRINTNYAGRSINLAMSARGWKALDLAGLRADLESIAIPMYGRYLHQADGNITTQPYSKNNEAIYSVSRGELNKRLMTLAEANGVDIQFNHRCTKVDVAQNKLNFSLPDGTEIAHQADLLFGYSIGDLLRRSAIIFALTASKSCNQWAHILQFHFIKNFY